MTDVLRIGTRDSQLARWQAEDVQHKLKAIGIDSVLIPIKSSGDLNLSKPLHQLGITGVFTRELDTALLNNQIDIAVHSMKDVPTNYHTGIIPIAVLEREDNSDVLLLKKDTLLQDLANKHKEIIIATGSLRRKAMWSHIYPHHQFINLRGNIQTRINKLQQSSANGAIMATAALKRLGIIDDLLATINVYRIEDMLSAPAQGAILITSLIESAHNHKVRMLNHPQSEIETSIERSFMAKLEGGCTSPIGCLAKVTENQVDFKGELFSRDGKKVYRYHQVISLAEIHRKLQEIVDLFIRDGAKEMMIMDSQYD